MKFVFHTNSVSPHQVPLARNLAELLGRDNYRYVYTTPLTSERASLGWSEESERWVVLEDGKAQGLGLDLDGCDVLMSSFREVSRFEKRAQKKLRSIYVSERWLKPIFSLGIGRLRLSLPGVLRLFVPSYFRMSRRIVKLLQRDVGFYYFAVGVLAAEDIVRVSQICGLSLLSPASWFRAIEGLFRAPRLKVERVPGGRVEALRGDFCGNVRLWGYFVAPTDWKSAPRCVSKGKLSVLWVGRMLHWKRVDSLVKAVRLASVDLAPGSIKLTVVGAGPEESRLRRLAEGLDVEFVPPVDVRKIRSIMRQNNVLVLPSNAYEGWGAIVSEALEEGLQVLGSRESGASLTLLPEKNLFNSGDVRGLAMLLQNECMGLTPCTKVDEWSVSRAAKFLYGFLCNGSSV